MAIPPQKVRVLSTTRLKTVSSSKPKYKTLDNCSHDEISVGLKVVGKMKGRSFNGQITEVNRDTQEAKLLWEDGNISPFLPYNKIKVSDSEIPRDCENQLKLILKPSHIAAEKYPSNVPENSSVRLSQAKNISSEHMTNEEQKLSSEGILKIKNTKNSWKQKQKSVPVLKILQGSINHDNEKQAKYSSGSTLVTNINQKLPVVRKKSSHLTNTDNGSTTADVKDIESEDELPKSGVELSLVQQKVDDIKNVNIDLITDVKHTECKQQLPETDVNLSVVQKHSNNIEVMNRVYENTSNTESEQFSKCGLESSVVENKTDNIDTMFHSVLNNVDKSEDDLADFLHAERIKNAILFNNCNATDEDPEQLLLDLDRQTNFFPPSGLTAGKEKPEKSNMLFSESSDSSLIGLDRQENYYYNNDYCNDPQSSTCTNSPSTRQNHNSHQFFVEAEGVSNSPCLAQKNLDLNLDNCSSDEKMFLVCAEGLMFKAKLKATKDESVLKENFQIISKKCPKTSTVDKLVYTDHDGIIINVPWMDLSAMEIMVYELPPKAQITLTTTNKPSRKKSKLEIAAFSHRDKKGIIYGAGQYKDLMTKPSLYLAFKRSRIQVRLLCNDPDSVNVLNPNEMICPIGGCSIIPDAGLITNLVKHLSTHGCVASKSIVDRWNILREIKTGYATSQQNFNDAIEFLDRQVYVHKTSFSGTVYRHPNAIDMSIMDELMLTNDLNVLNRLPQRPITSFFTSNK